MDIKKLKLHWQVLICMIIGVIIGVFLNPYSDVIKNPDKLKERGRLFYYYDQNDDNIYQEGNNKYDELDEYIKSKAETAYHPCGTCKMGVDDMAVVDENLKVKGIENLRVIDASVMPEIPSANLNAPTLMIAEKGADAILN